MIADERVGTAREGGEGGVRHGNKGILQWTQLLLIVRGGETNGLVVRHLTLKRTHRSLFLHTEAARMGTARQIIEKYRILRPFTHRRHSRRPAQAAG